MVKHTLLHANHTQLGAKMGEFAGYDMPLYYGLGVMGEHNWTREKAGLFDVSHMGQAILTGPGAIDFVERLTPSSYGKLGKNRTKYTVLTNPEGGIIDDLMVTKISDEYFHFVLNAGCKDKDLAWMREHLPSDLTLTYYEDWALLALQGAAAEGVLREQLGLDMADLPYMTMWAKEDKSLFISRLGYTGEDGFEISLPGADAPTLWDTLLEHADVQPVGLAARDSLRLEMAYPLYGHDIDDTTSPVEADIAWIMGKGLNTGFIGAERVLHERTDGPARQRIGFTLIGKGVAREGAEILNESGDVIGKVTSGGPSPTLGKSIGMGYVPLEYAAPGTKLQISVRGRAIDAEITAMPFMAAKTKSMKQKAA